MYCFDYSQILFFQKFEFISADTLNKNQMKRQINIDGNTVTISPSNSKTIMVTSAGKTVTLASGKITSGTQFVFSKLKEKPKIIPDKKSISKQQAENHISTESQFTDVNEVKKVIYFDRIYSKKKRLVYFPKY